MAIITDPTSLVDPTNIVVDTTALTIQLIVAGDLTTDGVTIKCVYSKLKELFNSNDAYIKFPFPMGPITDEQFEMIDGWDWADDTTRYLLRTGGWAVKNGGANTQEWAGIISLGVIDSTDQAYMLQSAGGSTVNFQKTGPINQAIQVMKTGGGAFDYRTYLGLYCRILQKSYAFSQRSEIGVDSLTYQAYRFPLANAADPKVTHLDAAMSGAPYSGMSITWHVSPQSRTVGGVTYHFHIIIDGNSGTAEQIYEFVQYKLRQATDIDAATGGHIGKKTGALLRFIGDTLYTLRITEGGVFIDNYQDNDINRLVLSDDDTTTTLTFPYVASLTLNFGDNLKNDAAAKYWVYFTNDDAADVPADQDYGTADAILVKDADDVDMTNDIGGASSVQLTFAYELNVQRGEGSENKDAPITVVGLGLSTGQFVKAVGTITRSISNSVSLVAPLERNYENL
jgi:hypothetical protein